MGKGKTAALYEEIDFSTITGWETIFPATEGRPEVERVKIDYKGAPYWLLRQGDTVLIYDKGEWDAWTKGVADGEFALPDNPRVTPRYVIRPRDIEEDWGVWDRREERWATYGFDQETALHMAAGYNRSVGHTPQ